MAISDAQPDVVIIGAGAGGAASAWALSRHGLSVLILEAGPEYDATDYKVASEYWEQHAFARKRGFRGTYDYGPGQRLDARWDHLRTRSAGAGLHNRTATRQFIGYSHVRGVGGSTLHFSGWAHRLHPKAFRLRSLTGEGADWPLAYDDLEPYYDIAERVTGVAGGNDDRRCPRRSNYPLAPHPFSRHSQILAIGAGKLGLTWTTNSVAALSAQYDGRPPCNYCGCCQYGCPVRDKGSVDVTFIPKALASGHCRIQANAEVMRIVAGPSDEIAEVIYRGSDGADMRVKPKLVILACGAIESPRLLLNSAATHGNQGLGNDSGQVGRNFMETVSVSATALHPEPIGSHRGLPEDSICWDYNAPDSIGGMTGGAIFTPFVASARMLGPFNYAHRLIEGFGRAHKQRLREAFGHAAAAGSICENLPNAGSFIDLSPGKEDANEMPLARINSFLPESEIRRLDFCHGVVVDLLKACGAGDVLETRSTYDAFHTSHVFGTCRMGDDPATSVVNAFGRSHRWKNLFVADASVFPSSGGGEGPSLTIQALAIRQADHISGKTTRPQDIGMPS